MQKVEFTGFCPYCGDGYFDLEMHILEECPAAAVRGI